MPEYKDQVYVSTSYTSLELLLSAVCFRKSEIDGLVMAAITASQEANADNSDSDQNGAQNDSDSEFEEVSEMHKIKIDQ